MKIVFLINRNDRSGGMRVIHALSKELYEMHHDILLVIRPGEPKVSYFLENYLSTHIHLPKLFRWISRTPLAYLTFLTAVPKCDVLIATFYPTSFIALVFNLLRSKTRTYYFVQMLEGEFSGGMKKLLAWLTYQLPIRIIVNSLWMEREVLARRHKRKIHGRLVLGLDSSIFVPKNATTYKKKTPAIIGTVGRLLPIKGLKIFWEVIRSLKSEEPIRVIVISIERIVVPSDLTSITTLSHATNDEEMIAFYHSLDVFVSTSFRESFSYPPLEAMSCGIPTVMTDNGGCGEYARNEFNTCITLPGDVPKLKEYVLRILKESQFADKIIKNGIATGKLFSWKQSAEQMIKLLSI
jgi:glycosyltransferase involved in cell wall biosynthesis